MIRYWQRLRAGSRLFMAFSVLAASTIGLAFMGWVGLNNTEQALTVFEQHTLPEISQSLALAERTANLAAVAPYVASVSSPFMLRGLSQTLEDKISHVLALAESLPQLDAASPDLQPLLGRLEHTANSLIEVTRTHLFVREDLRQIRYRLHQLHQELLHTPNPDGSIHAYQKLVNQLLMATRADTSVELNILEKHIQMMLSNRSFDDLADDPSKRWQSVLLQASQNIHNVFLLRRQQLQLQEQSAFLLASTRAVSEQLSNSVTHFVDQARHRIRQDSRRVGITVASGQTGILMISLLCLGAAAGGIWVVRELGAGLSQVTRVMTRLAEGDTHQQIPATERRDEIGELARAFQVFRENAVEIERISNDLRDQTQLLETVFLNINDGLSVFDHKGQLVAWNPRYLSMLSLPPERVHKHMKLEEIHALLPAEAQESWSQMGTLLDKDEINQARQWKVQRFERHFSDGRAVEFRSNPMPGGGFVTLYSDLTERKAIEAQLRQSQKMEVLGQLTGGVAHDFNNLLAAMFGNLQLVEDSLIDTQRNHTNAAHPMDTKRALKRIRRALATAERGNQLTRRLLAFSRKQRLTPDPTSVDQLIEGMEDLFQYSVAANIDLVLNLNSAPLIVLVDSAQLENALLNLAINASAAMPDGGTLTLTTRPDPETFPDHASASPCWIEIDIADTGCGIAQEHIRRVFEPFFTTKDIGEGSGLGLSMVYGFVKQSAGDIRIHSHPGQGTKVTLRLPVLTVEPRPLALYSNPDTQPAGEADSSAFTHVSEKAQSQQPEYTQLAQKHLLLIEDDDQVALVTLEQLQALAINGHRCATAEEAILWLEKHSTTLPDLVLSDINLGAGNNGLVLQQQIQQRYPDLPVLLTSGLNSEQLQARYGMTPATLLHKPYQRRVLAEAVCHCLKSAHSPSNPNCSPTGATPS